MMNKKNFLIPLIFILFLSFSLGSSFKSAIYFKVNHILKNPIFKLMEEKNLSDEILNLKEMFLFLKKVDPKISGFIVTLDNEMGYMILFSKNLNLKKITIQINRDSNFLLIGHSEKKIKFKFKKKIFNFILKDNILIFSKKDLKSFNIKYFENIHKEIKNRSELGLLLPKNIIKPISETKNSNLKNIINNWSYIFIFPEKYNPFILDILIKCNSQISSKNTKFFVDTLKDLLNNFVKNSQKYKDFLNKIKISTSTEKFFTTIRIIFGENFLNLFKY